MRTLVLVLVVLGLGAGCREAPAPGVHLVFRHARILGDRDPIPRLLQEFERAHPGVTVARESLPWIADVQHQFFVMNLEGRSAAFDVLMLDVIWIPEFARAGWLLDLTDRWPAAERAEHFPVTVAAATLDGHVWAVPWAMNAGLLYYRTDLLARHGFAPPRSFEELAAQATAVRAAAHDPALAGYVWQGKQYEGLVCNVLEGLWAAGTDLVDDAGRLLPDEARAARGLGLLRGLIERGVSPPMVTAADEESSRREFGAGRAVFHRNWPYARLLFEAEGSPVRGRVGIAPMPAGGTVGGFHLAVNRATRAPDAAWELVRFLTRPEVQLLLADAVGFNPTRPSLLAPDLRPMFASARPRPVTPWYQTISATVQPEFSAVLAGVKSPAAAVADARRRLRYFLDGRP